ncbi:hypothetical protein M988_1896 [Hafnia paralvei ATCC 29927]|nr:hypothetical protein M988_1896 [Hafnia paralvei ATCC 29927]
MTYKTKMTYKSIDGYSAILVKEDKTFYQTKPFAGSQFSESVLM